jgi:hypothetical protein
MCIHCLGHLKQSKKAVSYKIKYIFIIWYNSHASW